MSKGGADMAALQHRLNEMSDYEVANVAATLVVLVFGARGLQALRDSLALHNNPKTIL